MEADLEALMTEVLAKHGYHFELRPQQKEIINHLIKRHHTLGIMPTGWGKSMTYSLLPLILDEIDPDNAPHVGLIVCPLRSLIFDQVERSRAKNIRAVGITKASEMSEADQDSVKKGEVSLIYASPEALVAGPWVAYFRAYARRFCVVTLDELHCLSTWGGDFRPTYLEMARLRSKFTTVPLLGLSATVDTKVLKDVLQILELGKDQVHIIANLPDRPNIFLQVHHQAKYDMERDLAWVVDGLRQQKQQYPKTLIFCQTVTKVYDVYEHIKTSLGSAVYVGLKSHETRLVSMYHGDISANLQKYTQETITQPETNLRVLVTTIAFGMGVEVGDIRQVVHWGRVTSILGFWQEIGRAGRDGHPAVSHWYPQSIGGEEKVTFEAIRKNKDVCVRATVLGHFVIPGTVSKPDTTERIPCTEKCTVCVCALCTCCSHCKLLCNCSK